MSVDTKTVPGRRQLTFTLLGEVVADAEKLVASPSTKMVGNWPLSQRLTHLATAINGSMDGYSTKAPWLIRLVGPLMKGRFLRNKMSPGFKLPKDVEVGFFPATASPQEALEELRAVVDRTQNERMTARHPILGKMTHEDWTQLHLRHAELHLSFAVPG